MGKVNIELNLSFLRGLAISSGVTVSALEDTAIGDIEGGDSLETTKIGWSEYPSFPQS
jgi:hypothetical protein